MKVLHVITTLNDGGAEGSLFRLCKFDFNNKHLVVSLLYGGKYESKFSDIDVPVFSLRLNTIRGILMSFKKFRGILDAYRPDIVQTWLYHADLFGGVSAYILGYRSIFWNIRNFNTSPKALKLSTRIIVRINLLLSHFIPAYIISVSGEATKHHIALGFKKDIFINIPNGYDFRYLEDVSEDLKSLKSSNNFLIGLVARFDPQKDHFNLLKALQILKNSNVDFHCILVGQGMNRNNLKILNVISNLKLEEHVTLLGRRDDVQGIMQILDLHVLSSLGEAFPNVLVEAMGNRTPCVSTNVGDSGFIMGDLGWVVEPENPEKLARAIAEAYRLYKDDLHGWERLREEACESVRQRFSVENMTISYNKAWNHFYKFD